MPPANTAAVSGTSISSTAFNTLETDIGTEITNSVDRGGRSAMTAPLPMGGQKITGMADPTISTDGATKAYVDAIVASFFSTGDAKYTLKTTPDTSWVFADDGTIGSASSGASNRANADTQALFTIFFNNMVDAVSPLLTSGGGATTRAAQVSASAAWAANCRITLPRTCGRVLGVAGAGSGLTFRSPGTFLGSETNLINQNQLPNVAVPLTGTSGAVNVASGSGAGPWVVATTTFVSGSPYSAITNTPTVTIANIQSTGTFTPAGTTSINGGVTQQVLSAFPPTTFLNLMIKL